MPAQSEQRSGAVDADVADLVAVATDPAAVDRIIKDISDRRAAMRLAERNAKEAEAKLEAHEAALKAATEALERDAEKIRKELSTREAAVAAKEAEIEEREAKIARFNQMIEAA